MAAVVKGHLAVTRQVGSCGVPTDSQMHAHIALCH